MKVQKDVQNGDYQCSAKVIKMTKKSLWHSFTTTNNNKKDNVRCNSHNILYCKYTYTCFVSSIKSEGTLQNNYILLSIAAVPGVCLSVGLKGLHSLISECQSINYHTIKTLFIHHLSWKFFFLKCIVKCHTDDWPLVLRQKMTFLNGIKGRGKNMIIKTVKWNTKRTKWDESEYGMNRNEYLGKILN